eukprot:GFUD01005395.1.p1 GENE.GFUD01005395.1~~GFUD01005395.1.p1  ORF type:complete len:523 (+),score=168.51 GFUD01005395.1:74-1570(+)
MASTSCLDRIAALNVCESPGFTLCKDDTFGRYPVANRDLKAGETILEEKPLSWAPMLDTRPVCLTCLDNVTGSYHCPTCGWPMCSKTCAQSAVHRNKECSTFASCGVRLSCKGWDYTSPQPIYNLVTVLRVRAMKIEEKEVADSMEHHLKRWKEREGFTDKYKTVVDYALNTLKLDMTKDDILEIITNSYTNDFSHTFPSGNQVHLMFPLTAMLNHSCFPNIARSIQYTEKGFKIRVTASRPIKAGSQIFNSYIDILDPVLVRRKHLEETKNMICRCERCDDPTDLGTYGSAVLCRRCKGPVIPMADDPGAWQCQKCKEKILTEEVDSLISAIDEEQKELLANPKLKKIKTIEKFIKKSLSKLDSRNLLIVRLKYNLIGLYGREQGFTSEEMTETTWQRKKQICEEILETLKVLEPGLTVRKARLMYEMHLPLIMLAQVNLNKGEDKIAVKKDFQKGLVTLKVALKVFEGEPEGSWEKEMVARSQEAVKQIQEIMECL